MEGRSMDVDWQTDLDFLSSDIGNPSIVLPHDGMSPKLLMSSAVCMVLSGLMTLAARAADGGIGPSSTSHC